MECGSLVRLGMLTMLVVGCRQEPTIIIHFEPQDLASPPPVQTPMVNPQGTPRREQTQTPPPPGDGGATQREPPSKSHQAAARGGERAAHGGAAAECATDADCVTIKDGCCGCNQGGRAQAVSKRRRAEVEQALEKECGPMTMCVQMISTHPSCRAHAACRQHRCVLEP